MECQRLQSEDRWLEEAKSKQEETYREEEPTGLTDIVSMAHFQEAHEEEEEEEIQQIWEDEILMAGTPLELPGQAYHYEARQSSLY